MTEDNDALQEFLAALQVGSHDEELDEVQNALNYRRGVLNRRKLAEFSAGDKAKFGTNVKPKYLSGLLCTVESVDPEGTKKRSVHVSCPNEPEYRRFAGAKNVGVPLAIIERIK